MVSIHPVVSFQMAYDRFNGTSSLVPAPLTWLHTALALVGQVDGGTVQCAGHSLVAFVAVSVAWLDAGYLCCLFQCFLQGMTIVRVTVFGLGTD